VRLVADTVSGFKTPKHSSGSQRPKFRQELRPSNFGAQGHNVTILWGPGWHSVPVFSGSY